FLVPINLEQILGYTDVVKNPMDFGTNITKVTRDKYRSLDDFTNDVRLVTSNAKLFNCPGIPYHTEAEKLE
ncbi:Bromodomain-containing protein, partial [Lentinula edodes]